MMRYWAEIWQRQFWRFGLGLAFGISGAILGGSDRALAQSNIVPDETLGNENSVVTNNFLGPNEVITGGATRGSNLFHSFQEFNVSEGRGAYFFSPSTDIQNILARVTGSSRSEILGTLGTFQIIGGNIAQSNANLFIINPSGIIFGQQASLSVGGSFIATTANAIQFGNQGFFKASVPNVPSALLTVNPSAFFFNQMASGAIIKNNSIAPAGLDPSGLNLLGLRVPDGRSLLLLGGDVTLEQGRLTALGGRVELGGVAGAGTVGLNVDGSNLKLNFPDDLARANISLVNGAGVYVPAGGGGTIAVNAQNLDLLGGSLLASGLGISQGTVGTRAGDIVINAIGVVTISDSSGIANLGLFNSIGDSGDIKIAAQALSMINAAQINTGTVGQGNGGSVFIQTQDRVSLSGRGTNGNSSGILSSVASPLFGVMSNSRGGNINIQTRSLFLANGALVTSETVGEGRSGNIQVNASDSISMMDGAALRTDTFGQGDAGDLMIATNQLIVQDGSQVSANTFGGGNAGDLLIRASEVDVLETPRYNYFSTGIFASVERDPRNVTPARGNGGNLTIETGRLSIYGGWVSSETWGDGNAGRLLVQARDLVEVVDTSAETGWGSFLSANVNEGARGAGGNLTLETRQLSVRGSLAEVTASIFGEGKAGDLTIRASDSVELSGGRGGLFAQVNPGATGTGGNLRVETRRLSVKDGARVSVNTFGTGDAGSLLVQAKDSVEVVGTSATGTPSLLRADVREGATGRGGNLTIETGQLIVRDRAQVTVSSQGSGDAGDQLKVTAHSIKLDNQGQIRAETASGEGGNITLNLQDLLLLRHNSEISTSAGTAQKGGDGGNITINSPFIVAVPKEDSDITANAYTGRGGNINITTQGIYGLQFRPRRTPKSDITASSDFGVNGTVLLNSAFDVTQSVTNLPVDLVDASNQIDQTCTPAGAEDREKNRFIITGRGGLPPNPNEPLRGESVITNWVTLESQEEQQSQNTTSVARDRVTSVLKTPALVEAQGWIYGSQGEVILTAQAPSVTPHSFSLTPSASCNLSSSELSSK